VGAHWPTLPLLGHLAAGDQSGTTIITFLMVFLIQNTQNRDAQAIHLKLDELIRTTQQACNELVDLEECSDEDLERLAHQFQQLRDQTVARRASRRS
jgi:low affinity Fe/Cu permease